MSVTATTTVLAEAFLARAGALADEYLNGHDDDWAQARFDSVELARHVADMVVWRPTYDRFECAGVTWVPVDEDTPYADFAEMSSAAYRAYFRRAEGYRMQVSAMHMAHPVFTRRANLAFRVWHDTAHLQHGLGFDVADEVELFVRQCDELGPRARCALFGESIYQLAAYVANGEYPDVQYVRTPGPVASELIAMMGV
jgi:hypothetical protein